MTESAMAMTFSSHHLTITRLHATFEKDRDLLGKQDPQVVFTAGVHSMTTPVMKSGGTDCTWDGDFSMDTAGALELKIEVFNKNALLPDTLLGHAEISLDRLKKAEETSVRLLDKQGRESGQLTFITTQGGSEGTQAAEPPQHASPTHRAGAGATGGFGGDGATAYLAGTPHSEPNAGTMEYSHTGFGVQPPSRHHNAGAGAVLGAVAGGAAMTGGRAPLNSGSPLSDDVSRMHIGQAPGQTEEKPGVMDRVKDAVQGARSGAQQGAQGGTAMSQDERGPLQKAKDIATGAGQGAKQALRGEGAASAAATGIHSDRKQHPYGAASYGGVGLDGKTPSTRGELQTDFPGFSPNQTGAGAAAGVTAAAAAPEVSAKSGDGQYEFKTGDNIVDNKMKLDEAPPTDVGNTTGMVAGLKTVVPTSMVEHIAANDPSAHIDTGSQQTGGSTGGGSSSYMTGALASEQAAPISRLTPEALSAGGLGRTAPGGTSGDGSVLSQQGSIPSSKAAAPGIAVGAPVGGAAPRVGESAAGVGAPIFTGDPLDQYAESGVQGKVKDPLEQFIVKGAGSHPTSGAPKAAGQEPDLAELLEKEGGRPAVGAEGDLSTAKDGDDAGEQDQRSLLERAQDAISYGINALRPQAAADKEDMPAAAKK